MATKQKKFIVARVGNGCIRVYPENQTENSPQTDVKKRRVVMYDYGVEDGFSITPQQLGSQQPGTVFKIADFPCCSLHESKNKFFIRMSFTKATCADAERIIKRDSREWFKFLSERQNASSETKTETKTKTKTKTDVKS